MRHSRAHGGTREGIGGHRERGGHRRGHKGTGEHRRPQGRPRMGHDLVDLCGHARSCKFSLTMLCAGP